MNQGLDGRRAWLAGGVPARAAAWLGRWLAGVLLGGVMLAWLGPLPAHAGALPGELPTQVGRANALQGDLQWYDRDSGDWQGAGSAAPLRNWPVSSGDRLRTGAGGRAELRIGSSTVRLGERSELWLQRLDGQAVVLHLRAGSLALRLPVVDGDGFGPVELLTREGRWLPRRPGHYRLDRDRDAAQATAWQGELRFEAPDSALDILPGRRADLWQDPPGTTRYAWAAVDRDAFADWVAREDRQDETSASARHVPPGMSGWQDLDRHGDWVDHPDYGQVWAPRGVAPGWRPYQDGRWAWVAPWGWTWIDAAPWGFAPFHFGLWIQWQGRWCWSPGPRHEVPRYAPALSGWVSGASWGVTVRIGERRPPPPRVVVLPPPPPPRWVVVPAPRPVVAPPPRWDDGRDERHQDRRDDRRQDRHGDQRTDRREDRRDERRDDRRDDRRGDGAGRGAAGAPLLGATPGTPSGRAAEPPPRMTLPTPVPRQLPPAEERRDRSPAGSERPARAEAAEPGERGARAYRGEPAGRLDKADRAERGERAVRADRNDHADRADRADRGDRGTDRPERGSAR